MCDRVCIILRQFRLSRKPTLLSLPVEAETISKLIITTASTVSTTITTTSPLINMSGDWLIIMQNGAEGFIYRT
ncbi:hypothetical protein IMY05_010G0095000 [Salix suchowensis]|nr:hypothetical protein IMY05_010G0095000 [Salix suchowensis]